MRYKIVEWDGNDYTVVIEADLSWEEATEKLQKLRATDKPVRGKPATPRTIVPMDEQAAAQEPSKKPVKKA